jgi:ABC-2 type transport system ATP-binding protein
VPGRGALDALCVIRVEKLSKHYGATTAVHRLSFEVRPGRVTAFLGPNGAGKTTTLRMILGLVRPHGGTAEVDGAAGAVLEDTGFHPGRSGRNHLRVLAVAGSYPPSRVDEVLSEVGLADAADRRVRGYSLGMRQRLAIAAALLGDPQVLILDEPANGLDPPGIRWIRDLMRAEAARGRTVLVSSHVLAEVVLSADDVVVISDGVLRAAGPVEEVLGARGELAAVSRSLEDAFLDLTGVRS